ncbi:MAG: LysR family transcriptional regulator [Thermodesulfobacteriota bacterium]
MELRYLEIFVKVVEKKSFSLATEDLSITRPTVSILL